MISLSDKTKDEFTPIDIASFENFDEKMDSKGKDTKKIDLEQFKTLFDGIKNNKASDGFDDLFGKERDQKNSEDVVFKQFGEKKIEPDNVEIKAPKQESILTDIKEDDSEDQNSDSETELESDSEPDIEPGYDDGFDQGLEDGKKEGYEKGFDQGRKEGHEEGVKKGYTEGYEKGELEVVKANKAKFEEELKNFEEILKKLDDTYYELAKRYETKIISLICNIAEKVVFAKLEIDDGIIKDTILDALNTLNEPEEIILNISEQDYEYIEMVKEDIFDSIKSLKSVSVKSDASLTRGGCRIETENGYVETDIESKLEKVFASIKGDKSI